MISKSRPLKKSPCIPFRFTWSLRKSHFLPPRSYSPTPPSRKVHTTFAGGRAKWEGVVPAGARVGLVEDTWWSLPPLPGNRRSTFIVCRAWIPVFLILIFSIGVDLDTFHILRIPLLTSTKKLSNFITNIYSSCNFYCREHLYLLIEIFTYKWIC